MSEEHEEEDETLELAIGDYWTACAKYDDGEWLFRIVATAPRDEGGRAWLAAKCLDSAELMIGDDIMSQAFWFNENGDVISPDDVQFFLVERIASSLEEAAAAWGAGFESDRDQAER